ncbi:hypothetical protein [Thermogemmatispora sp.]|uniref:hypothetical protein n=1 Tax=Thermogemmatispora sp. TaxID=1968838 RepID=UPI001D27221C|nr:hypothetical protein [Thermogemmatispora sp.]MBX5450724.1 hypothetical protein [Thermogemmatispora sp.]
MVRREEDLRFEQEQQGENLHWHRRAERGRKRLSASVEDVLAERASAEPLEEDESGEEPVSAQSADIQSSGLIPPRLSLQSRELAASPTPEGKMREQEQPGSGPDARALTASGGTESDSEEKGEAEKLATNRVFAAFARRVTASLAALGKVRQPQQRPPAPITAVLPALSTETETGSSPSTGTADGASLSSFPEATSRSAGERPLRASSQNQAPAPQANPRAHETRIETGTAPGAIRPAPALPQPRETPARSSSQRLAGRTTRVRLEAAPKLSSPSSALSGPAPATPSQSTRPLPALGSGYLSSGASTRPDASASSSVLPPERPLPTSGPLRPSGPLHPLGPLAAHSQPQQEQSGPGAMGSALPLRWQVGRGCFARGQGEVAVSCPAVSEASVVLVTLTGDPGPVVVQYVSLQPGRGFTVHLSAPTQRETPFHYAVLESVPLGNSAGRSTAG